jgi:hypothetical protein
MEGAWLFALLLAVFFAEPAIETVTRAVVRVLQEAGRRE